MDYCGAKSTSGGCKCRPAAIATTNKTNETSIRHRKWCRRRARLANQQQIQVDRRNRLMHPQSLSVAVRADPRKRYSNLSKRIIFHEPPKKLLQLAQSRPYGRTGRPRSGSCCCCCCYRYYHCHYYCICSWRRLGRHFTPLDDPSLDGLRARLGVRSKRAAIARLPTTCLGLPEATYIELNYHNSRHFAPKNNQRLQFNQPPFNRRRNKLARFTLNWDDFILSYLLNYYALLNSIFRHAIGHRDHCGQEVSRNSLESADSLNSTCDRLLYSGRKLAGKPELCLASKCRLPAGGRFCIANRGGFGAETRQSCAIASTCQDQVHCRLMRTSFRGIISDKSKKKQSVMVAASCSGRWLKLPGKNSDGETRLHNNDLLETLTSSSTTSYQTKLGPTTVHSGSKRERCATFVCDVSTSKWLKLIAPVVLDGGRFSPRGIWWQPQRQQQQPQRRQRAVKRKRYHLASCTFDQPRRSEFVCQQLLLTNWPSRIGKKGLPGRPISVCGLDAARFSLITRRRELQLSHPRRRCCRRRRRRRHNACPLFIHPVRLEQRLRRRPGRSNEELLSELGPCLISCSLSPTNPRRRKSTRAVCLVVQLVSCAVASAPAALAVAGGVGEGGSAQKWPRKCNCNSLWRFIKPSEPKRRRARKEGGGGGGGNMSLVSAKSTLTRARLVGWPAQIIVEPNELTMRVVVARQHYDYICIDCRQHGALAFVAAADRLAEARPVAAHSHAARRAPLCTLCGLCASGCGNEASKPPLMTAQLDDGLHCNEIMGEEAANISETKSGLSAELNEVAATAATDEPQLPPGRSGQEGKQAEAKEEEKRRLAEANLCTTIACKEKSLNNNNNNGWSAHYNAKLLAGHLKPAHYERGRLQMQCQCRHYYYHYYYYYRCRLVGLKDLLTSRRDRRSGGGVLLERSSSAGQFHLASSKCCRDQMRVQLEPADKLITGGSGDLEASALTSRLETRERQREGQKPVEEAWFVGPKEVANEASDGGAKQPRQSPATPLELNEDSNEDERRAARPRCSLGVSHDHADDDGDGDGDRCRTSSQNMSGRRMSARKSHKTRLDLLLLLLLVWALRLAAPQSEQPVRTVAAAGPTASGRHWAPQSDKQAPSLAPRGSRYEERQTRLDLDGFAVMSENNAKTSRNDTKRPPRRSTAASQEDVGGNEFVGAPSASPEEAGEPNHSRERLQVGACKRQPPARRRLRRRLGEPNNDEPDHNGDSLAANNKSSHSAGCDRSPTERANWNEVALSPLSIAVGGALKQQVATADDQLVSQHLTLTPLDGKPANMTGRGRAVSGTSTSDDELAALEDPQGAIAEPEQSSAGRVKTRNDGKVVGPPSDDRHHHRRHHHHHRQARFVSISSQFDGPVRSAAIISNGDRRPQKSNNSSHDRWQMDTNGQIASRPTMQLARNNAHPREPLLIGINVARPLVRSLRRRARLLFRRSVQDKQSGSQQHHAIGKRNSNSNARRSQKSDQRHHGRHQQHLGAMLPIITGGLSHNNINTLPSAGKGGGGQGCPVECQCVWKNGKQFADCSNHRHALTQLPFGLDPLLQVLNISSNHLAHLPDSAFVSHNLHNLQRIYMSSCQMESIHSRAFDKLKLVVELDFSWNKLNFVPVGQMKQLILLRRLTMRGNPLYALNETTIASGQILPARSTNDTRRPHLLAGSTADESSAASFFGWSSKAKSDRPSPPGEELDGTLVTDLNRLFETYPELIKSLVEQYGTLPASDKSKTNQVDNLANDGRLAALELKMMQTLLKQDQSSELNSISVPDSNSIGQDDEIDDSSGSISNELDDGADPITAGQVQFGAHFAHLQELDFGQCKLTYIKWTVFEHFDQLKRLYLDGNQLSQLSGKLVRVLPVGLHQLSLEGNPWHCDCRLAPLKRWLQSTRTPLSAPVRCHWTPRRHQMRSQINQALIATKKRNFSMANSSSNNSNDNNSTWPAVATSGSEGNEENDVAEDDSGGGLISTIDSPNDELKQRIPRSLQPERAELFDQLALEDFVCAPQANLAGLSSGPLATAAASSRVDQLQTIRSAASGQAGQARGDYAGGGGDQDGEAELSSMLLPSLNSVREYLGHTLIRYPSAKGTSERRQVGGANQADSGQTSSSNSNSNNNKGASGSQVSIHSATIVRQHKEVIQTAAGDKVTLKCSFLAYPESSLDIVWLVDYNHRSAVFLDVQSSDHSSSGGGETLNGASSGVAGNPSRLPAEERFIVLYDSKLHRSNSTSAFNEQPDPSGIYPSGQQSRDKQFTISEISLYSSRILIRETRSINEGDSIVKESRIIIQPAHVDDSARYKCIALNKAGNSSIEYLLRVTNKPSAPNGGNYIPSRDLTSSGLRNQAARDQRAQQGGGQNNLQLEMTNKARILAAQISQVTTDTSATDTSWLKGSTAFQITIVIVSALMAVVIIAFLLFCVSIYQIKPNFNSTSMLPMQNQQWKGANGQTAILSPAGQANSTLTDLEHHQLLNGFDARATLKPYQTNQLQQPLYGIINANQPITTAVNELTYNQRAPVHLIVNQASAIPATVKLIEDDGFPRGSGSQI